MSFDPTKEHKSFEDSIRRSHKIKKQWEFKYEDLPNCYNKLQEKLNEVTNRSKFLREIKRPKEEDTREIKIPETTNGVYGWLVSRKDFKYFGCEDVYKPSPIPQEYKLIYETN